MNYAYAFGFLESRVLHHTEKMTRILKTMEDDINRTEYLELTNNLQALRTAAKEALDRGEAYSS